MVGEGGENNFEVGGGGDASEQVTDAELLGADAVQGRKRSVKDVVYAIEITGLLDGMDAGWFPFPRRR